MSSKVFKTKGFSLMEIIVTLGIIAVLSSVGFIYYSKLSEGSRDKLRKSDLGQLAQALEIYYQKNGKYIDGVGDCSDSTLFYTQIASYLTGPVPKDPNTKANYCYVSVNNGASFRLFTKLENCKDPDIIPGIDCTTAPYNFNVPSEDLEITVASSDIPLPPPTPTPGPTSIPVPTIDTLAYFLTDHPAQGLTGTHPLSQTVDGQASFYVKWNAQVYEIHTWDSNYIYLQEDHSGAPVNYYSFNPGIWMRRQMTIGEKITQSTNTIRWYGPTCSFLSQSTFPIEMTLESHIPNYNAGGSLGVQDVIVLKYDSSVGNPSGIYEKFYYSKEWGWIKWEEYTKPATLNNQSTFNTVTVPILPDKSVACTIIQTPAPTP